MKGSLGTRLMKGVTVIQSSSPSVFVVPKRGRFRACNLMTCSLDYSIPSYTKGRSGHVHVARSDLFVALIRGGPGMCVTRSP